MKKYKIIITIFRIVSTLGVCVALYGIIPLMSGFAANSKMILMIIAGAVIFIAAQVVNAICGAKLAKIQIKQQNDEDNLQKQIEENLKQINELDKQAKEKAENKQAENNTDKKE